MIFCHISRVPSWFSVPAEHVMVEIIVNCVNCAMISSVCPNPHMLIFSMLLPPPWSDGPSKPWGLGKSGTDNSSDLAKTSLIQCLLQRSLRYRPPAIDIMTI